MQLNNFKSFFFKTLEGIFPTTEIDTFYFLLTEEYLNLKRIDVALNPNLKISEKNLLLLNNALKRLKNQEPIQYILGKTTFYGLPFLVNNHTLIPRPETEELVAWIIKDAKKIASNSLNILDIGTGSGCIAVSLAKNLPNATITAIDIAKKALIVARQNATKNAVNITFIETDILQTHQLPQQYDIIVSNPPYVRQLEKQKMQPNVLENEPHIALFVTDENPLIFYKQITGLAKKYLTKNGKLYVEINQYLKDETTQLFKEAGFLKITAKQDIFKNDRMICAAL